MKSLQKIGPVSVMLGKGRHILVGGALLSILALIAIAILPASLFRLLAVVLLVCFFPGWALVEGIFAGAKARPVLGERLLLGLGAGYIVTIVGGLWLYYLLGQLIVPVVLTLYVSIIIIGFGLAFAWRHTSAKSTPTKHGLDVTDFWWLLGLLVFAAYFRFYFLSYSDYRGDEAEVVLRAISAIRGQGEPILSHTKGPSETLLTTALGLLYGSFEELPVRIPFALANCLAVASTYLLGKYMFGRRVAIMATALVVINGWFVTYARTAQYQNLVLFSEILAMWCFWRFYQARSPRFILLGTLFLAVATFGHYEGAAAGPAILYLLILGLKQRGSWRWQSLWPVVVFLLPGVIVVLSFYVPFILNPAIDHTQSHLSNRFGETPPYNNWDAFYVNGLFYNSIYYVLGVGLLLLLGLLWGVRQVFGEKRGGAVAVVVSIPLLLLSWTGLLPPWYALIIFLIYMGLFLFSPSVRALIKANLLWILLPFCLYLFGVVRPGNHYYVFIPPLILLIALTLDRGWRWLSQLPVRRWILPVVMGILLTLFGLSTWYEYLVFMRTDLEYMLTYPEHRQPLFPSDPRFPFDIRIGWGFPYRLGWQTVSQLYREGQLAGDWYSTDENNSIYWYTLGWPRNPCFPRYYMLTEIGYKEPALTVPLDIVDRYYTLRATVEVNNQPRLRLYEFAPEGSDLQPITYQEPAVYSTLYQPELFKGEPLAGAIFSPTIPMSPPHHFKPHPEMLAKLSEVYNDPNTVFFPDRVSLLGYDLDETWAKPGGLLALTLYWHADSPVFLPYKIFTHLGDAQVWAQADDQPGCGQFPTYNWRTGDIIMDRHVIFLPGDIPPGEFPIQVGLYEIRSGLRMDLLDEMGNPAGNAFTLPSVAILPQVE